LMARLHEQYRLPLPQGIRICAAVFKPGIFTPTNAAFQLLEFATKDSIGTKWFKDLGSAAAQLARQPLSTIVNVANIWAEVSGRAEQILQTKT